MADTTFFVSPKEALPAKPDLARLAPQLNHRRTALETLRERAPKHETQVDIAQLALIAGTMLVTALGATLTQGLSVSSIVAGACGGLGLSLGATRMGLLARMVGLRTARSIVPTGMMGIGTGVILALGLTTLPLLAITALSLLAAIYAWRTQRDLISENLLAREIAAAREDLDRDSAAFADDLRAMQAKTEAEVARLCRKAGIDPKRLDPKPDATE